MPYFLKKIAFIFILFAVSRSLVAQIDNDDLDRINLSGGPINTAVPFLLISPDARAGAMGDAGVSSSPDINAQHWNAAKYPFIDDKSGLSLTYSPWLRTLVTDMNLLYLTGYHRLDENSVLAGSLRFFSLGKVIFRSSQEDPGTEYNPNEYAVDLSYSRKLSDYFSIAVAGRYIRSDLASGYKGLDGTQSSAANSGAADISMFYTREITTPNVQNSSFALGLNISNIGAKLSYSESFDKDFLPANLRFGGSYTAQIDDYNQITGMLEFSKLLVPTPAIMSDDSVLVGMSSDVGVIQGVFQSFYDAPGGFREELQEIGLMVGAEYWYNKVFAFRGGYFFEHRDKGRRRYFTLGAGLKFSMLEVDVSYLMPGFSNANNPLKNTLRFTLKFNLSEYIRQQNAKYPE